MSAHWVYIVRCSDGTYYTGYTTNIARRIVEHNEGAGAKYTRGRTPVTLQYRERFESKAAALKREYEIKQLSRSQKTEWIREYQKNRDSE